LSEKQGTNRGTPQPSTAVRHKAYCAAVIQQPYDVRSTIVHESFSKPLLTSSPSQVAGLQIRNAGRANKVVYDWDGRRSRRVQMIKFVGALLVPVILLTSAITLIEWTRGGY